MTQDIVNESLWQQFGASIEMLRNAIVMVPEEKWLSDKRFFKMSYHTLFFLDYYLTNPPKDFKPLLAFEFNDQGHIVPNKHYSKLEILEFLEACRSKCKKVCFSFNDENIADRWIQTDNWPRNYQMFELMMYNMRHVQHHSAQMNMMLRELINDSPDWVSRADGGD